MKPVADVALHLELSRRLVWMGLEFGFISMLVSKKKGLWISRSCLVEIVLKTKRRKCDTIQLHSNAICFFGAMRHVFLTL